MALFSKLRGTYEAIFQVGKGGPNIKNNSGVIEVRNSGDSGFVNLKASQVQSATALLNGAIQLKDDGSGNLQVRDSGDTAYKKLFALDPLVGDTQGVVTVAYFNANPPAGVEKVIAFDITEDGASTTTQNSVTSLPNGAVVTKCAIYVTVAFDQNTPSANTVTIGTSAVAAGIQNVSDNDPQTASNAYKTEPYFTNSGAARTVLATLARVGSGAGVGAGRARVYVTYIIGALP